MSILHSIVILITGQLLLACNHKNNIKEEQHIEVKTISFTSEEDDPEPPPPNFTSKFRSLEEWLLNVIEKEKPEKHITNYKFGLFETKDEYTLCLTGINTNELSQNHTQTTIDFSPEDMYYALPKSDVKGLKREEVLERTTAQLKKFTKTEQFKHSFFIEADSITTDWNREAVWAR
jgi:hypothetical protein